jgi:hypothetical protein
VYEVVYRSNPTWLHCRLGEHVLQVAPPL